ncbi:tryptophan 7-halogenase [Catenovulum sp. 2E275]|uniref:tryptophan halogenase family protein n=1 Tax=Catenovulum sp. 2E275 TaxID=2980497 RepID=UPI0021D0DB1E|nr:tryptophan halogenase family protein [Catenovulum sp. 2E275]MCU4674057.1 tryptophan 7-halogenase [Catenovulum sp. 2E275]
MKQIKKVVIVGGGSAGWMSAAALGKLLGNQFEIVLIESEQIGTVGVGEATIPTLHIFNRLLDINEQDLMAKTNATFKLGIQFEHWKTLNDSYIHSFGEIGTDTWACGFHHFWLKAKQQGFAIDIGDYTAEHLAARQNKFAIDSKQNKGYAFHLDAGLFAQYLRNIAEKHQVKRVEGLVTQATLNPQTGDIETLTLDNGEQISGDLFIDCSGFSGLLIEKQLHTGFDNWAHYLPCDKAVAVQTESLAELRPYTRAIAHQAGWRWQIPLQNRCGNGLVYSSHYLSDDEAVQTLLGNCQGQTINSPRLITYQTGTRRKHWHKNCVAIGLSAGFIEPLESTGIHLFQAAIIKLLQNFPVADIHSTERDEFNLSMQNEMKQIRDFIVLHYCTTKRTDSPFWQHCQNMEIPESLKHRIEMFRHSGRIGKQANELFDERSWVQVMLGMGIEPMHYHPVVDRLTQTDLQDFVESVKHQVKQRVARWPSHQQFIQAYCPAK